MEIKRSELAVADDSIHPNDGSRTERDGQGSGPSKAVATLGIALVVVVVAIAIGVRLMGNSSSGARSAVRGALVSTFTNNTAALSITESIDVEGQIGTAKGIGKCNLHVNNCTATLNYGGALAQLGTESMVYSDRIMYLKLAGTVGASFPTPWIFLSTKASNRPSALGSTGSPLAGLALLTSPGAVLKDEGMVSVKGASMHQYGVTIDKSSATKIVDSSTSGLPTWMANPATKGSSGLSMTLDVNAAGTIGQIKFTISATQDRTYAIVHATETVTGFGAPVTVAVPAKKQLTFVDALAGTLTRYCAPPPGMRLGQSSKPIITSH
jgi:hypothetical protein